MIGDRSERACDRSAVAYVPDTQRRPLIAVGPTRADDSTDGGETWRRVGTAGFHAVGFAGTTEGWAVGTRAWWQG
jgi:hypothetical protein